MDVTTFKNKLGETYGVADGYAFVTKAGIELNGDFSTGSLRRAKAEVFNCNKIDETRLHENDTRSVTLVIKKGVRVTDVETLKVKTYDEKAQRAFVTAIIGKMRPTQESKSSSLKVELIAPAIATAFVAILGGLIISMSFDNGEGSSHTSNRIGKARLVENISGAISHTLGTTGSIIVFGLLIMLCVAWFANVILKQHVVNRWRVS